MIDRGVRKSSLALACARNSHFRWFSKSMKIYGKIDPQIHPKSFKTDPWGGQGRFIDHFYWFWAVSKNQCFLISSWGVQVRPGLSPEWWLLGSGAEGRLARGSIKQQITGRWCVIWHADGRRPGEFFVISVLWQYNMYYYSFVSVFVPLFVH